MLAVFFVHPNHLLFTQIDGGDKRAQVAVVGARGADVGKQQFPDFDVVLPALFDFDGRDAQTLVENLGRFSTKAAGGRATDFGNVANGDGEAHDLVVDEYGFEEGMFGRVQATAVGVVVDDDVAVLHFGRGNFLQARLHQQWHAADLRGAVIRHGDHVAVHVGNATGKVKRLVEDGRIRGLHQHNAHLATDGHHGRLQNVHGYKVHGYLLRKK